MIDSGIIEEARLNLGMLFPEAVLIHREISVTWRSKGKTNNNKRTIILFLVQNIQKGFMHVAILMEKLDSIAESFPGSLQSICHRWFQIRKLSQAINF